MRYTESEGPPSCPATLPEPWRAIWDEVIQSVGSDHWRLADGPVVEAYVTTLARLRSVQEALARDGEIDADGNRTQASRVAEACAKVLAQIAPKLRLCPSARHDARQANRTTSGGTAMDAYLKGIDALRESHAPDKTWKDHR